MQQVGEGKIAFCILDSYMSKIWENLGGTIGKVPWCHTVDVN